MKNLIDLHTNNTFRKSSNTPNNPSYFAFLDPLAKELDEYHPKRFAKQNIIGQKN